MNQRTNADRLLFKLCKPTGQQVASRKAGGARRFYWSSLWREQISQDPQPPPRPAAERPGEEAGFESYWGGQKKSSCPRAWYTSFPPLQISQEAGKVVWYSHIFKNFLQFVLTHTFKAFSIVNEAEEDFFFNLLAFSMIQQMLAIWSLFPLPFLNPAWTPGSSYFTYCWNLTWRIFEHYFASMWNECNCVVVWTFFGIALLWDWNGNLSFPVLWPLLNFPNLLA